MFQFLFCLLLIAIPGLGSTATILVMGDSISAAYGFEVDQGWPALLQQKLDRQGRDYQVVNASISGETSAGGLSRIDQELQRHHPAIVIIELGANDGLRGYPPARMKANLKRMIERSRASGAQVLLLGMRIPPNYGRRYTEMFYRVYSELEKEQAVAFVPFLLDGVAAQTGMIQHDGLHPNAKAQPVIMELVSEKLEPMLNQGPGNRDQATGNSKIGNQSKHKYRSLRTNLFSGHSNDNSSAYARILVELENLPRRARRESRTSSCSSWCKTICRQACGPLPRGFSNFSLSEQICPDRSLFPVS